jgi:hypothetical protein
MVFFNSRYRYSTVHGTRQRKTQRTVALVHNPKVNSPFWKATLEKRLSNFLKVVPALDLSYNTIVVRLSPNVAHSTNVKINGIHHTKYEMKNGKKGVERSGFSHKWN